jgi:serine/threonine-protein kinase RsbW
LLVADPVALQPVSDYVKLDIPAKAEYVVLGRLALAGLLKARGYSDDAVADLKLALTEACSNSVRHAYDDDDGQVHLVFSMYEDRVVVEICDDGAGFDLDQVDCVECTAIPGIGYGESGLGISIIRAVVDEFDLRKLRDGGTALVLTKLRDD